MVDTAALIAYVGGSLKTLGKHARRAFRMAEAGRARLAVPTVCLFEVSQLEERGRLVLDEPFERWCDRLEKTAALVIIPLERTHVSEARTLPALRDPFDRLIAGTAIALGLPLITSDTRVAESRRVRVVW